MFLRRHTPLDYTLGYHPSPSQSMRQCNPRDPREIWPTDWVRSKQSMLPGCQAQGAAWRMRGDATFLLPTIPPLSPVASGFWCVAKCLGTDKTVVSIISFQSCLMCAAYIETKNGYHGNCSIRYVCGVVWCVVVPGNSCSFSTLQPTRVSTCPRHPFKTAHKARVPGHSPATSLRNLRPDERILSRADYLLRVK